MGSTRQERYANNLRDVNMGLPISIPVPYSLEEHVGCVGDVFYFDEMGDYKWVFNAFHAEVQSAVIR
jgi:hypothetical protein